jgi:hypothetical protein
LRAQAAGLTEPVPMLLGAREAVKWPEGLTPFAGKRGLPPFETSTVRSGLSVEYRPGLAAHDPKSLTALQFSGRIFLARTL